MSTSIPSRSNGQTIDASWFNTLKTSVEELRILPSAVTSDATLSASYNFALIDASGGAVEITLPSAVGNEGRFYFLLAADLTNAITVTPDGTETINGAASYSFNAEMDCIRLDSDGANWFISSQSGSSQSVVNPTRLDVKKDTRTNLDTYATTASNGQLCFATDEKLMYQIVDGFLVGAGGGGGAGDSDTIQLLRANDESDTSLFDLTGSNASFDGGGTISGTVSLSTDSDDLILTGKAFKYVADAGGSANDYFGITLDVPQGFRGRNLGVTFEYKNDSTVNDNDFRFCFKLKDGDSAGDIQYSNLTAKYSSDNEAVRFAEGFFVPTDCTQVEIGWQNTDSTGSIELIVDNVLFTANPFLYKNLTESQYIKYDTHAGYGSTNTRIPYFTNAVNVGSQIGTITNSATLGFAFTAIKKCLVTVGYTGSGAATHDVGLSLNSTQLTTDIMSITQANKLASVKIDTANYPVNVAVSIVMNPGDVLRPHRSVSAPTYPERDVFTLTALAESEHVVTPAKSGIEEIYYDGYTSTSTYIKFKTQQRNTLSKVASVDNTTYTKFTALKKCIAMVHFNHYDAGAAAGYLHHFSSTGTQKTFSGDNASTINHSIGFSVLMEVGDYIVTASAGTPDDTTSNNFGAVFVDFEQQVLSAIPVQKTCYLKDVQAYNTDGGTTSNATYYTRTLNTINEDGSTTSGSCSFVTLSSNQFTIQPGRYKIKGWGTAFRPDSSFVFLRDTSAGTNDIYNGLIGNGYSGNATDNATIRPEFNGEIELTVPKTFELKQYIQTAKSTNGLGVKTNVSGYSNVYSSVEITKIK